MDNETSKKAENFEEILRSPEIIAEQVSPKHKVDISSSSSSSSQNNNGEEELENNKSLVDDDEVSPKHTVDISSSSSSSENNNGEKEKLEDNNKPVVDNDDDDEVSSKPILEIQDMIEEMESIDIHEPDTIHIDNDVVDDDDSESSSESKEEEIVLIEKKADDEQETIVNKEEEEAKPETTEANSSSTNVVSSPWTEKAAAIKDFVRVKSKALMRGLSSKTNDDINTLNDNNKAKPAIQNQEIIKHTESPKSESKASLWNPLSYLKMMQNEDDSLVKGEATTIEAALEHVVMKGRIILYTKLGCEVCRECRLYLHEKRLRYVEINIDIYPTRKLELEKISTLDVPQVFFNEELVGGLKELKELEETGKLEDKIKNLIEEAPSREAPLPPFSGEDDASAKGPVDELALIVLKMKPFVVKDKFYKLRRFKNCFLGSEAVDFLVEDQNLQREEAVEVAKKLASELFFQHVLDENLFEDGNHLYRFLDDDPIVSSQCHNIPKGIIELKPRPIEEIASRLRLLYSAILEAYTSSDGKHVDYRSIHGSEEFARYLRIIQELHRVEIEDMQREEKLAFFINLYNMMAIHGILVWGHPLGPLERTKMFNEFKYVIGGCTYSLSAIQNGILRGNQRPPYNLMKPFGSKDKRSKVALPYAEPLSHFALVCGTRSGPSLRCFSPGEIDKELMEAARGFLRGGGLIVDLNSKVAYISKIFNWYGVDFGKGEEEVLKHASTYLEPQLSEALLDLLVDTQFRVVYQSYDWGINN